MDYLTEKTNLAMRVGIVFALITLFYGFSLGMIFGAAESSIKGSLKSDAEEVFTTVYGSDEDAMKAVLDKSWTYFKRAHLHANGLGTSALALILVIVFFGQANRLKSVAAVFLGVGSLGYSSFWMFAGMKAPGLGSTGQAKEALAFLATPSVIMCAAGLVLVLVEFLRVAFRKNEG